MPGKLKIFLSAVDLGIRREVLRTGPQQSFQLGSLEIRNVERTSRRERGQKMAIRMVLCDYRPSCLSPTEHHVKSLESLEESLRQWITANSCIGESQGLVSVIGRLGQRHINPFAPYLEPDGISSSFRPCHAWHRYNEVANRTRLDPEKPHVSTHALLGK